MSIHHLRAHYGKGQLLEKDVLPNPLDLFDAWFKLALADGVKEPNAMVLGTIDKYNKPRSRVVLLKEYHSQGFVFYTNYLSHKSIEIDQNPHVCLTFLWLELEKQIRIEGTASKVSSEESDDYFNSRPEGSKIGAHVSQQSQPISSREELELKLSQFNMEGPITRPANWGGYIIKPELYEFWQGRANRLHDRIEYNLTQGQWNYKRLQP
jgi:pyridoxamine 5'-phosphate oxidase